MECNTRIEMGLHYRIPYPRPIHLPPMGLADKKGRKFRMQERLRKFAKPVYLQSHEEIRHGLHFYYSPTALLRTRDFQLPSQRWNLRMPLILKEKSGPNRLAQGLGSHHFQEYRCTVTGCIPVWYGGTHAQDRKRLQRVVNLVSGIMSTSLHSIKDSEEVSQEGGLLKDPHHKGRALFSLLTSGRRYRSLKMNTQGYRNSFFLSAIRLLNGQ
ncbi:LYR motif containing protein 1 isoform X3 [Narcine bancroftii]